MSVRVKIELTPEAEQIVRDLQTLPPRMLAAIARSMDKENQFTTGHIQREYMSFPADGPASPIGLRVQTNRARGSLRADLATVDGQQVSSAIGSNVDYLAAHEFGAEIPAQDLVPTTAKALRFTIGNRVIFAKKVHLPPRTIPARAPIQRGINDRLDDYSEAISAAIVNTWEGKP